MDELILAGAVRRLTRLSDIEVLREFPGDVLAMSTQRCRVCGANRATPFELKRGTEELKP
jgi:hypothetical protein